MMVLQQMTVSKAHLQTAGSLEHYQALQPEMSLLSAEEKVWNMMRT